MTSKRKIDQQGRECTKCGEYKLWSEFHKNKTKIGGHEQTCKPCKKEIDSSYRIKLKKLKKAIPIIDDQGRECNKCGDYKLWSDFPKSKKASTGHKTICKKCTNIQTKKYRNSKVRPIKKEKFKNLKTRINPDTGKPYTRGDIFDGKIVWGIKGIGNIPFDYDGKYRPFDSYEFDDFVLRYINEAVGKRNRWVKSGKISHHNLTEEHLLDIFPMDMMCPIYDVKMTFVAGKPNSIELDKMDRDRGYVIGNVAWISAKANRAKSDSSKEELQNIVNFLESKGL